MTDAALKNADAIDQLSTYYAALSGDQEAFNKIPADTGMNAYETRLALEAMIGGIQEQNAAIDDGIRLKGQEEKANSTATSQSESAADAYIEQADAVQDLNSQLTSLIDRINAANGVAVDAITANANYLSALDGLSAQAEKVGTSLDESTVSGSANAAAMGELAEKARAAAEAQFQQDVTTMGADESAKKYAETLAAQRQAFIDSAVSAGYNADQVKALADRIFQMPTEKQFRALVETAQAQAQIDQFVTLNNGRRVKVFVDAEGGQSFRVGSKTVAPGMSSGGPVRGSGPKGKDSELRLLAPGEHVIPADEVDAAGGHGPIEEWRSALASGAGRTNGYNAQQSEGSWVSVGGRAGYGAATQQQQAPVMVSLAGAEFVMMVDGNPVRAVIQEQLADYDYKRGAWTRGGARRP